MDYVTGAKGFIGKHLTARLDDFVAVPHFDIHKTDFSPAKRVFFLSAYGNMADHENENAIIRANILDLIHTLRTVEWEHIESFVFISTSSVKLKIQTMYSRTKKAAEEILLAYTEKYEAPITIINRPLGTARENRDDARDARSRSGDRDLADAASGARNAVFPSGLARQGRRRRCASARSRRQDLLRSRR